MNNEQLLEKIWHITIQAYMNVKFFEEKRLQNIKDSSYEEEKIKQWQQIFNLVTPLNAYLYEVDDDINVLPVDVQILETVGNIQERINNVQKTELPLTDDDNILLEKCMTAAEEYLSTIENPVDIPLFSENI